MDGLATLPSHFSINQAASKSFFFFRLKLAICNAGCAVTCSPQPISGTRPSSCKIAHLAEESNEIK